jgi:fructose-bisphosphate aldolase class I
LRPRAAAAILEGETDRLARERPLASSDPEKVFGRTESVAQSAAAAAAAREPSLEMAASVFIADNKFREELISTARALVAPGKGILAADESTGTIDKRFKAIKVENTRENRRAYRHLLITTPGLSQHISGIILYEETLKETTEDGKTKFTDMIRDAGLIIGIKTDKGTKDLPYTDKETMTQGLTDLGERCAEYYKLGARFCKWRVTLRISERTPSQLAIAENAACLARYAAISQVNGLMPIVEPEVLMDGAHPLHVSQFWTEKVLAAVYKALNDANVILEGTLLKVNMATPGEACPQKASPEDIALATVRTLQRTVPPAVPGIVFLSGGQGEEEATVNLQAINAVQAGVRPWRLSFSYGRALQQSCLQAWSGKPENVAAAQRELLKRAKANGEATEGKFKGEAGGASAAGGQRLFEKNYVY